VARSPVSWPFHETDPETDPRPPLAPWRQRNLNAGPASRQGREAARLDGALCLAGAETQGAA
jgi:hypothetical protein